MWRFSSVWLRKGKWQSFFQSSNEWNCLPSRSTPTVICDEGKHCEELEFPDIFLNAPPTEFEISPFSTATWCVCSMRAKIKTIQNCRQMPTLYERFVLYSSVMLVLGIRACHKKYFPAALNWYVARIILTVVKIFTRCQFLSCTKTVKE